MYGDLWYKNNAKVAPPIDRIVGNNLYIKGKLNSASTKAILLGCVNKALPKKSDPIPTNKSEKINPKNILNTDKINNV